MRPLTDGSKSLAGLKRAECLIEGRQFHDSRFVESTRFGAKRSILNILQRRCRRSFPKLWHCESFGPKMEQCIFRFEIAVSCMYSSAGRPKYRSVLLCSQVRPTAHHIVASECQTHPVLVSLRGGSAFLERSVFLRHDAEAEVTRAWRQRADKLPASSGTQ